MPSESPISPLSIANPSGKGRSSLQACSHRNARRGLRATSRAVTTAQGKGGARGRGGHSFPGLVLWWCGWWKRRLAAGDGASLLSVMQPAHRRNARHHGHSSEQTNQHCRQVSCQARKRFTLQSMLWIARNWHLLIIMKLGSYIDNESCCRMLCEVGCLCYVHMRSNTRLVWRTAVIFSSSWF